ncbi:rhamnulokinase family protein [Streptomyces sp. NPDC048442]|uniref:rhamnulokinase n=1 Tax=Streptomyces sp. NPDC048442 TaxID=3154823 RepID=UPI00341E15FD
MPPTFAAIDLGATSGRVILGRFEAGSFELTEAHRFPHAPQRLPSGLHWDVGALRRGVFDGLRKAGQLADIRSVGVDTWAVDYGLLDADGALLGAPYHYRDSRTDHVPERIWASVPAAELYRRTGLQHLPFNTVFQLAGDPGIAAAHTLLLMPDLVVHWLTGTLGTEETNASTTGLLDARTRTWDAELLGLVGLSPALLAPFRAPGSPAGGLLPHVAARTGLPVGTPVTTVASHDTASAVVAVPAASGGPGFAYISCGTWSLAGLELDAPVLTEASRAANFTNERGLDGTVRFLRNLAGLWLLEESLRTWRGRGLPADLHSLLAEAAACPPLAALVDTDAPEFLPPGDMPARIHDFCVRTGQRAPATPAAVVRCILDSLALAHRRTLYRAAELTGRTLTHVHLVGGGARNALLCRLTADATGLPVTAGPAEATALGNILVQARAAGLVGDLDSMRQLVRGSVQLNEYLPSGAAGAWEAAANRLIP